MSGLIIRNFTGATSVHYNGGIPYDADGAILVSEQNSYTWDGKPSYLSVDVGTVVNITDVGGSAGSYWRATAAGWVPLNGSVKLAHNWGTVAFPIGSITGSTGGLFTVSGGAGSLTIPAASVIPGHSILCIRALFHRVGANATASTRIYLGTAGTASDSMAYSLGVTATTELQNRPDIEVAAISSSSMISTNWLNPGNTGASATPTANLTANINTNSSMVVSFGVANANALDSFYLIGYSVLLESI